MEKSDAATHLTGSWNYPTAIQFGIGSVKSVPSLCRENNIKNPLLVCDRDLVQLSFVQEFIADFTNEGISLGVFSDVKTNPTGENVEAGKQAYNTGNHDAVIAMGGGSGLDAAKAIALMVGQDQPLWDFEDEGDNWTRVNAELMAPVIAIPTTSGTGSEVGRASVIVDEERKKKVIIYHPNMMPGHVVCDPQLTVGLPPGITAATGLDAFVHCFEAYCSPGFHPMADGIALEGMRLVKENLQVACSDGKNLVARANMMAASSMGATAFQKGLGGVHALAHPLGAIYDKHHGLLNAILLPYVVKRNFNTIEGKLENIVRYLQLDSKGGAECFIGWILSLRKALNIPNHLSEIGINGDRADEIGRFALEDQASAGNPIQLSASEYTDLFRQALG